MDIYLTVLVNADTGHAEKLLVKPVKGGKTPLYACEAGCQYDPVEVGCVLTLAWCVTNIICVTRVTISENEVIETTFYTLYKMTSKKTTTTTTTTTTNKQTNKQKSGVKFANCFSLAMFSKCYLNLFFLMPEIELENFIWNYFSFNYIESYKTEV